jgi:hypothetical protein
MANTIQDEILQSFLEVSQQQTAAAAEGQSLADLILQADQVRQDMAQQNAATSSAATRSSGGSQTTSSSGDSGFSLSSVFDVFKSGLGLSPLVQGIASLFGGGGDSSTPEPLVKYALPPAINFQAAEVGGQIDNLDYNQDGTPRQYGTTQTATMASPARSQAPDTDSSSASSGSSQAPQITVNVQAMDARSFLDRSSDIALAVRDAMLNLNAINDVVNDL